MRHRILRCDAMCARKQVLSIYYRSVKIFLKDYPLNKKIILSWCGYDFAASAYSTVIITFVFAAYFTGNVAVDKIQGTFLWGRTIAISGLLVAILSPLMGAMADLGGQRKTWLFLLTLIASIATTCLWFAYPYPEATFQSLLAVAVSFIAIETAQVFYNALLAEVAPIEKIGRVSGWGLGAGYLGGLLSLCICLLVFIHASWLPKTDHANIRIIGPFVAGWLLLFSAPLFFFVPDKFVKNNFSFFSLLILGFKTLLHTLRNLSKLKLVALFLLARMIYTDGLNTLFAFGGIYAAGTLHFSMGQVLLLGILLNIAAGIGALIFAVVNDYIGCKATILGALSCMILLGIFVLCVNSKILFLTLAPFLGLFIGPTQSASRSLMLRLAPREKRTEMFGLYSLTGRATAIIGPLLVSSLTLAFASQRIGMSVVFVLFIIGGGILAFLPVK